MSENKFRKNNLKGLLAVRQGMSFVEVIIGIFIFGVVMFAVTNIFTSSFNGYKKAEKMAKNIEDAQYVMNLMAKIFRTSSIVSVSGSPANEVRVYNHSEGVNSGCKNFIFDNTTGIAYVQVFDGTGELGNDFGDGTAEIVRDCGLVNFSVEPRLKLAAQFIRGGFMVTPSNGTANPKTIGKATISIKACSDVGCSSGGKNDTATLQTTVSLRDYSTVGL